MYVVKNNEIYFVDNNVECLVRQPTIVYDSEDNLLLKHGDKQDVELWYAVAYNAYLIVNHKMASNLRIVEIKDTPERTVDFLNKAITITGFINKQLLSVNSVDIMLCH